MLTFAPLLVFLLCLTFVSASIVPLTRRTNDHKVVILGGGMAGVTAAQSLDQAGIKDFVIVEARSELGGRVQSAQLASGLTIELGANWIEGISSSEC